MLRHFAPCGNDNATRFQHHRAEAGLNLMQAAFTVAGISLEAL